VNTVSYPSAPGTMLSYEETLRTLGTVLDSAGSDVAVIDLTAARARIKASGSRVPRAWTRDALAAESERQRRDRGGRQPGDARARQLSHELRLVGADLDRARAGRCTVTVGPEEIIGLADHGERFAYERDRLARHVERVLAARKQPITCPICDEPGSLHAVQRSQGEDGPEHTVPTHRCSACRAYVSLIIPSMALVQQRAV
jgi:hypothetical protein